MKQKRNMICVLLLAAALSTAPLLTACAGENGLKDGYFTAQAADYNYGWKEYVTILVKGGKIISVEYNAENPSGFIKSWDNSYMQTMLHENGTYPNEYTRVYAGQLLEGQQDYGIEAISGASSSASSFEKLAAALLRPPVLFGNETVSLLESAGILWYDNECKRGTTSFRRKRPGRIKQGF